MQLYFLDITRSVDLERIAQAAAFDRTARLSIIPNDVRQRLHTFAERRDAARILRIKAFEIPIVRREIRQPLVDLPRQESSDMLRLSEALAGPVDGVMVAVREAGAVEKEGVTFRRRVRAPDQEQNSVAFDTDVRVFEPIGERLPVMRNDEIQIRSGHDRPEFVQKRSDDVKRTLGLGGVDDEQFFESPAVDITAHRSRTCIRQDSVSRT